MLKSGCVAKERVNPVGRVVVAGGVGNKCLKTAGRVRAPGGVVTERVKTNGGIAPAACQAKERKIPLGGIEVGIASVRWRIYRLRPWTSAKLPSVSAMRMKADRERRMVRSDLGTDCCFHDCRFCFCFSFFGVVYAGSYA